MTSQGYGDVHKGGGQGTSSEWPMPQFWSMVDQAGPSGFKQGFGGPGSAYGAFGREEPWNKEQSDKRRLDRNSREQKRSKRISDQIKELKTLLEEAGVNMAKGNKSSILTCAAEYIMDLQMQNEVATRRARELASAARSESGSTTSGGDMSSRASSSLGRGTAEAYGRDGRVGRHASPGRTINYRRVFHDQSVPVALTAVDGRFIDCNWRFERESGYSKDQLRGMTFFSLVAANGEHGSVFQTVAHMLKDTSRQPKEFVVRATLPGQGSNGADTEEKILQLSTIFADDPQDHEVKYFCCALLSMEREMRPSEEVAGAPRAPPSAPAADATHHSVERNKDAEGSGIAESRRPPGDDPAPTAERET
uniref:BHLH domain-containing protein n=2 Tax=Rhizochromulina marina TaxID=1034831 RepID=A0A7S2R6X3_9STRA|mmetsp:Transcript_11994/g.34628  ORF Transcript_11994/g.34628 Transcript_11994/m.34628 type:complete len:364 (+) Transcript_11994:30-1121(+)